MSKQLVVITGGDKGKVFDLPESGKLIVGRSKETDTKLTDARVSRKHCHVEIDGEKIMLVDANSTEGTFVNDKRISQHQLFSGDVVRIGNTEMRYEDEDAAEAKTVGAVGEASGRGRSTKVNVAEALTQLVGSKLDHFQIGPILGQGHSSMVFRATDINDDRKLALKVFAPEFAKNEKDARRFLQAMQYVTPLRHPNLMTVYDTGREGPYCWMALECIEGSTLVQKIQRDGPALRDWQNALRIAIQVCKALKYLHDHEIIHRNVSPRCLYLSAGDVEVKLGGLEQVTRRDANQSETVSRPDEILRDAAYMPPERARSDARWDARSDIYSLGATLYYLLMGKPPFEGRTAIETMARVLQEEPVQSKEFQQLLPDAFQRAMKKMLGKRPELRQQDASDLLTELERIQSHPDEAGTDSSLPPPVMKSSSMSVSRTADKSRGSRTDESQGTRVSVNALPSTLDEGASMAPMHQSLLDSQIPPPGAKFQSPRRAARATLTRPSAYEVLEEIGRGELAVVYRARDLALKRHVAIKEIDEKLRKDPRLAQHFWEEAQFLASLEHDNIVQIYGIDKERGWIIMELMRSSIDKKLASAALSPELVRSVLRQVLQGLSFLHQHNKLHGGVKPPNVLINNQGRVKLSDSSGVSVGEEKEVRKPPGTQKYLAPELLNPEFGTVGAGVDLYCLGFTALEMLVGPGFESLFRGVGPDAIDPELGWLRLHGSRAEQVPKTLDIVPEAPPDLAHVIDRLLAKDVKDRYASAADALKDLADCPLSLFEAPPTAPPATPETAAPDVPPWSRAWINKKLENPWVMSSVIGLIVMVTAMAIMAPSSSPETKPKTGPGPGKRSALLVGVRQSGAELPPFQFAEADMMELSRVLQVGRFPSETKSPSEPKNLKVMTQSLGSRGNEELTPSRDRVVKAIQELTQNRQESDSILLALAGHLVQFPGSECYFCPADANLKDPKSLIPLNQIYEELAKCSARTKLVLLDVCRRRAPDEDLHPNPPGYNLDRPEPQKQPPPEGVTVVFSCRGRELGTTHVMERHGLFYHFVIQALIGGAVPESKRLITADDLIRFLQFKVADYARESCKMHQQPVHYGPSDESAWVVNTNGTLDDYYGAQKHLRSGKKADALSCYQDCIKNSSRFVEAYLKLATLQIERGFDNELPQAISNCETASGIDPTDATSQALLAQIAAKQKRYEQAINRYLKKAIELDPDYAGFLSQLGQVYAVQSSFDNALANYDKALQIDPRRADIWEIRGQAYAEQKKWELAIKDYDKAISLDSQSASAHLNRALAYQALGKPKDLDLALLDLDEVIKLKPGAAENYFTRGQVRYQREKYNDAVDDFTQAINRNWNKEAAYVLRGQAHTAQKRFGAAIEDLNEAIKLNAKNGAAYYYRAQAYKKRGDTNDQKRMEEDLEMAKKLGYQN